MPRTEGSGPGLEPCRGQQRVDRQTEAHGTGDDGRQIEEQGLPSEDLSDDEHRGDVRCRPGHQQHEGSPGRQTFQHQRRGNRHRSRGAEIHRDRESQDQQHTCQRMRPGDGEEVVGDEDRDGTGEQQPDDEPASDILHHLTETVAENRADLPGERAWAQFAARRGRRAVRIGEETCGERTTGECRDESGRRTYEGKGQAEESGRGEDRIDAGLGRCNQERDDSGTRSAFAPHGHGRRDDAAGTERQRHAEECGQRGGTSVVSGQIAGIEPPGNKCMEDSGDEESQQQIRRHFVEQRNERQKILLHGGICFSLQR